MKIQLVIGDHQDSFLLTIKHGTNILMRQVINKHLPNLEIRQAVLGIRNSFRFCFWQGVVLFSSDVDFLNLLSFAEPKFLKTWLKDQTSIGNFAINYYIGAKETLVWGNAKNKLKSLLLQYEKWEILISKVINPVDFWLDKILGQSEKKLNLAIFVNKYILAWQNFSNQWEFKLLDNLAECLEFINFKINCKLQIFNFKSNNNDELELLSSKSDLISSVEEIC